MVAPDRSWRWKDEDELELAIFAVSTIPGVRAGTGFDPLLDGWLQGGAYVTAAVLCSLRALAWRVDRPIWAWFSLALGLRAAAFVVYLSYVRELDPLPYRSPRRACVPS